MPRTILRPPLLYLLIAFLFARHFTRRVVVRGWSMYPTLAPGERVLFDALTYRLRHPRRGDVVLAKHPTRPSMKLLKRVAAVPGDRVTAQGDDWRVEETSGQGVLSSEGAAVPGAQVWTLGEDEYFLLGDAPDLSTDARHFGAVSGRDILARAWLVYWPLRRLRKVRGQHPR
jgi:signal peptidase I